MTCSHVMVVVKVIIENHSVVLPLLSLCHEIEWNCPVYVNSSSCGY
jgi:hypothetical protein